MEKESEAFIFKQNFQEAALDKQESQRPERKLPIEALNAQLRLASDKGDALQPKAHCTTPRGPLHTSRRTA